MRRLIAIANQPAVFIVQFGHLDGTAAVFVLVAVAVQSRMCEVKQKCPVAAHHHVAVTADVAVVRAGAGRGEQIHRLLRPVARIVGTKHAEAFPFVNNHPEFAVPAETFRPFATAFERQAFVRPVGQVGTFGVMDGFASALVVVIKPPDAVRHSLDAGVNHAVGRERQFARIHANEPCRCW